MGEYPCPLEIAGFLLDYRSADSCSSHQASNFRATLAPLLQLTSPDLC